MPYPLPAVRGRWTRAGNGFVPTDIAGLKLWLDFSDITTLYTDSAKTTPVVNDGDVIGAVEDKSGNGRDFTQTTTAKKPTHQTNEKNGLSVSRYDRVDDHLDYASPIMSGADLTFFVVAIWTSSADNRDIYSERHDVNGTPLASVVRINSTHKIQALARDDGNHLISALSASVGHAGSYMVLEYTLADPTIIVYKNSAQVATQTNVGYTGTATTNHCKVGSSIGISLFYGDIGEILLYSGAKDAATRTTIRDYLNSRWAVYP